MSNQCVICKQILDKDSVRYRPHVALPVAKGECCDACNYTQVLPARLKEINQLRHERFEGGN